MRTFIFLIILHHHCCCHHHSNCHPHCHCHHHHHHLIIIIHYHNHHHHLPYDHYHQHHHRHHHHHHHHHHLHHHHLHHHHYHSSLSIFSNFEFVLLFFSQVQCDDCECACHERRQLEALLPGKKLYHLCQWGRGAQLLHLPGQCESTIYEERVNESMNNLYKRLPTPTCFYNF